MTVHWHSFILFESPEKEEEPENRKNRRWVWLHCRVSVFSWYIWSAILIGWLKQQWIVSKTVAETIAFRFWLYTRKLNQSAKSIKMNKLDVFDWRRGKTICNTHCVQHWWRANVEYFIWSLYDYVAFNFNVVYSKINIRNEYWILFQAKWMHCNFFFHQLYPRLMTQKRTRKKVRLLIASPYFIHRILMLFLSSWR